MSLYARKRCSRRRHATIGYIVCNDKSCIQDTLSSRALGLAAAFRPSARASKGILHTTMSQVILSKKYSLCLAVDQSFIKFPNNFMVVVCSQKGTVTMV